MSVRSSSILATTMSVMCILLYALNTQCARAVYIRTGESFDPPAIMCLTLSEVNVTIGATFTVNVTIINVSDMYAWQIELFFDPKILNCTSAWYPDDQVFAGKDVVSVNSAINNTKGSVCHGCSLLGVDQKTFGGNGTLCQIQFTGVSPGNSSLEFSGPESTFLLDYDLDDIPVTMLNANTVVGERLRCDLNDDQKINIADVFEAAKALGSYPRHQKWNPAADINSDGRVNIADLLLIVYSFM